MKRSPINHMRLALMAGCATVAFAPTLAAAQAGTFVTFDIPAQDLDGALTRFGQQSEREIIISSQLSRNRRAPALQGKYTPEEALGVLLAQSGLTYRTSSSGSIVVEADADPQGGSAAGGGAEVEGLIVTAQKREENIQDVPIAMSAFSQEALEKSQVAGGPDLYTQVPNFSFTKTNFSGYSIQIRGIGTQAISATTDPAVAVAFNNTPFVHNRFFEQEFFDLERLEVLRGPQGTLYGRNATAGVVNIISAKPKFYPEAKLVADVGNYNTTRLEGMVNIPLVDDAVALRLAGAWTKRDGYAQNQMTGKSIDGRDLWSTRLSLRFEPTDWISANLIWEHFEEDDDRIRSGKQLCKTHTPTSVGGISFSPTDDNRQSYLSQGCERVSLYSPEAFQTPNGYSLPYVLPLTAINLPLKENSFDVYASAFQSRDLRVIESTVEPDYRAKTDIAEFQLSIDLNENLTLTSETAYGADQQYSLQDYNRFTSIEGIFAANGGYGAFSGLSGSEGSSLYPYTTTPDGYFCDPQLGCSNRLLLVDLSTTESRQFNQEFRLGSDFEGPFNFSLGANYTRMDAETKYYVFINTISLWAAANPDDRILRPFDLQFGERPFVPAELSPEANPLGQPSFTADPDALRVYDLGYIYTDPNPIGALDDMGRNYFLSKNPYKLISYAIFGEAYYNVTDALKITGGLRFTVDRKTAPQIPSWLLAGGGKGPYSTLQTIFQEWREPTGRLAIDWKPDLSFTDETLVYASYAHGYKAGGANPPPPVFVTYGGIGGPELLPDTFDAEFVDAFEVGTKNTLFDGRVTLNLTGFYYDYKDYQVSEIRNRSAVNSNYDAEVWGLEIEADWRPLENLKLAFKGGYNGTRIADGETAIDLMDRTAGDPNYVLYRPFPSVPSNCIIPLAVATEGGQIQLGGNYSGMCLDLYYGTIYDDPEYDPYTPPGGFDPSTVPNGGRGISKQLGGNELPNAPDYTATLSADYTLPLANDWLLTFHGDTHWQSDSWWRVFNDHEYSRLDEFYTVNLAAIFENDDAGWRVMAYVKNALDNDALTGAFLNSDDSGLTTNVFLVEPRLYGLRVTKAWSDAPFLGGLMGGDGSYPFQVELGGAVSRLDGDVETYNPWIPDALAAASAVQEEDLDWGDIRDIKLTYAPDNGWRASAAYRWGRTNGSFRGAAYEDVPGWISNAGQYSQRDNRAITAVRDREEFEVAEFMVGKEVGLGAWGEGAESILSVGLRYAAFESRSNIGMDGIADAFNDPGNHTKYTGTQHWNHFQTFLDTTRKFEGTGPALSWESAMRLAGDDHGGHVDLDWKLGGAVLFGKQRVESSEDRFGRYYYRLGNGGGGLGGSSFQTTLYDDVTPVVRSREDNAAVPNLTLELGLSYSIDRVKVSTGYSYDRFFDVIDGGFDEAKQYDRTIQGPYLKLSLGFGG
jgi:iron complex outermembrane receptor protein